MSRCSRCGTSFNCGSVDKNARQPCWCTQLPALTTALDGTDEKGEQSGRCFCPDCLRALLTVQAQGRDSLT